MIYVGMCVCMGLDFDFVFCIVDYFFSILGVEFVCECVDWLFVKSWGNDFIVRKKGEIVMEMIDYFENWILMFFGVCGWKEEDMRVLLE